MPKLITDNKVILNNIEIAEIGYNIYKLNESNQWIRQFERGKVLQKELILPVQDNTYEFNVGKILEGFPIGRYFVYFYDFNPEYFFSTISLISNDRLELRLNDIYSPDTNKSLSDVEENELKNFKIIGTNSFVYINKTFSAGNINRTFTKLTSPLSTSFKNGDEIRFVKETFDQFRIYVNKISEEDAIGSRDIVDLTYGDINKFTSPKTVPSYSTILDQFSADPTYMQELIDYQNSSNDINGNFEDFSGHVYFGSAERVVNTAYYKLNLWQNYHSDYASASHASQAAAYSQSMLDVYSSFTPYEKWLYKSTGSANYPKDENYNLLTASDAGVGTWYDEQITSASEYDSANRAMLTNHMSQFYFDFDDDNQLRTLIDMMGAFFDNIKLYIDQFPKLFGSGLKDWEHAPVSKLKYVLKFLGAPVDLAYSSDDLFTYLMGHDPTDKTNKTVKQISDEFMIRLINNYAYIKKTKGTKEAVVALSNLFGIPQTLLPLREKSSFTSEKLKPGSISDYAFHWTLQPPSNGYINISGAILTGIVNPATSDSAKYNILLRTKFPNLDYKENTNYTLSQSIYALVSGGSGENYSLYCRYQTGSFGYGSESYNHTGAIGYQWGSGSDVTQSNELSFVFSSDRYYTLYSKYMSGSSPEVSGSPYGGLVLGKIEAVEDRIISHESVSVILPAQSFKDYIFNGRVFGLTKGNLITDYPGYSGSIMEFKFYKDNLSSSVIESQSIDPRIIYGNDTASTETLAIRWRFNEKYDLTATASIKDSSPYINQFGYTGNVDGIPGSSSFRADREVYGTVITPSPGDTYVDDKVIISDTQDIDDDIDSNNVLSFVISPIDQIDRDIQSTFAGVNFSSLIGDPKERYSYRYSKFDSYKDKYFSKYSTPYDFESFFSYLQYFNDVVFKYINHAIPESALVEKGILIKQHMLERSKIESKPILLDSSSNRNSIVDVVDSNTFSGENNSEVIATLTQNDILSLEQSIVSDYRETPIESNSVGILSSSNIEKITTHEGIMSGSNINYYGDENLTGTVYFHRVYGPANQLYRAKFGGFRSIWRSDGSSTNIPSASLDKAIETETGSTAHVVLVKNTTARIEQKK